MPAGMTIYMLHLYKAIERLSFLKTSGLDFFCGL